MNPDLQELLNAMRKYDEGYRTTCYIEIYSDGSCSFYSDSLEGLKKIEGIDYIDEVFEFLQKENMHENN